MTFGGNARAIGAPDGSDRQIGDLAGEASGRRAITLMNAGDSVSFTNSLAGANAIVIRYSIPDALDGGGQPGVLDLSIANEAGAPVSNATLKLTSRYAWLYGGIRDGVQLYNVPANANQYGRPGEPKGPTHLYDEIQIKMKERLHPGYSIKLTKSANDLSGSITIDFIELEAVPPALPRPPDYLSITDPSCGAIGLDTHGTGEAFDGADDSSYGSVFHPVIGINPFNVVPATTQEKDYYSTDPLLDTLQDTRPNAIAGGLSMFELADHNFQSLQKCIDLVGSSGGAYRGVWIPAGRFYARGFLQLPDNIQIRGAGMWYSKFAAVDTAAPVPVTFNGVTGISSKSGNLVFAAGAMGSDSVALSDFSMFGNVTQRDSTDTRPPHGVIGMFTNSHFNALWIEHYTVGFTLRDKSSRNLITNSRVRNTLADGFDLFGSPEGSFINHSHARSNGDDGFAIWSQGIDPTQLSTNNKVSDSLAQLQWIGGGFSIYGGAHNSVESNEAFDTLRNSCVQVSTNFVPSGLPPSTSMSASAGDMNLHRCGGNGFNQQFGALLVGVEFESLDGIVLRNINIYDPSYKGIDLRQIGGALPKGFTGTFSNVTFNHVQVYAPPVCSAVGTFMKGNAQFNDVCVCQGANHIASVCSVANSSATTFQVNPNTCSQLICRRAAMVPPSGVSLRHPPVE
jgi:hypothetical protein